MQCESGYFGCYMDAPVPQYDLAIAWTWQYDLEFVQLLEQAAVRASLKVLVDAEVRLAVRAPIAVLAKQTVPVIGGKGP